MEVNRGKRPTSTMIDEVTQICGGEGNARRILQSIPMWQNTLGKKFNWDLPEGIPKGRLRLIWGTKGSE